MTRFWANSVSRGRAAAPTSSATASRAQGAVFIGRPFNQTPMSAGNGTSVIFLAPSRDAVDRFWQRATALGGRDEGAPGLRPHYHANYYGAYLRDLDGNKIGAVCHAPAPDAA